MIFTSSADFILTDEEFKKKNSVWSICSSLYANGYSDLYQNLYINYYSNEEQ